MSPKFKYKALDSDGKTVRGEIEAVDEQDALDKIKTRNLSVYQLRPVNSKQTFVKRRKKLGYKHIARYIRQMAVLLSAGVTLLEALKSLSRAGSHPALAKASNDIRSDLRAGERFSVALQKHLPMLPPYVPRLAELGEATGQAAKALTDAADRMEFEQTMRSEIKTALSYPIFLSVVGSLITLLLFLFVVPRFGALIGDNRDNLPLVSQWVIGTGAFMRERLYTTLLIIASLVIAVFWAVKNQKLRMGVRTMAEKMPIIGSVLIQAELGNWARTVGSAIDNGSDLISALRLGVDGLRSPRLKRNFDAATTDIRAGRHIDSVFEDYVPDFDPLTIDLIRTGRTSGQFAKMLLFIGSSREQETRESAKRLAAITEPIAILIIAAIVGTVVISIVLAMTSLYDFAL